MQQEYIDILFQLQCCLATKTSELIDLENIGSSCSQEESDKINELVMYLRTLKRQNIEDLDCLTLAEIKNILNKANDYCQECCLQINKLK